MEIVDTITFTEDNMYMLLEAYDAYYELVDALKLVNGGGGDLGIVSRLSKLESLVKDLSPIYDPKENVSEDSVFWNALINTDQDFDAQVKTLMGIEQ